MASLGTLCSILILVSDRLFPAFKLELGPDAATVSALDPEVDKDVVVVVINVDDDGVDIFIVTASNFLNFSPILHYETLFFMILLILI